MRPSPQGFDVALFAYGSSLSADQMKTRGVRWEENRVEPAELENYELIFRGESTREEYLGGGLADLQAQPRGKVKGVVFWTDGDLAQLDREEGVLMAHPKGCCRIQVVVHTRSGDIVAQTYVRKFQAPPNPPHAAYLRKILDGANDFGLPEEWIGALKEAAERSVVKK